MHAACRAEFAASHLCHYGEYVLSNSATQPPDAGAWLDPSCADMTDNLGNLTLECNNWGEALPDMGRQLYTGPNPYEDHNCTNWTSTNTAQVTGLTIQPQGGAAVACSNVLPLACCNTVFLETFRGFTSGGTAGNAGGRPAMNRRCATEFAGSHLCHVAEYHRASPTSVPVAGAWVDASSVGNYGFITTSAAMGKAGRFTGFDNLNRDNCKNWMSGVAGNKGYIVQPAGTTTSTCNVVLPVACCGG